MILRCEAPLVPSWGLYILISTYHYKIALQLFHCRFYQNLALGIDYFIFISKSVTPVTDVLQGGKVFIGDVVSSVGNFVRPTIVEISPNADVVKEELFVPVLYVIKFTVASS